MQRCTLFGLPVTAFETVDEAALAMETLADTPGRCVIATNINPHAYHLAKRHEEYCGLLWRTDFVYPDGIGIVYALSAVLGVRAARVSFDATSLYHPFFRMLDRRGKSLFVVGAKPGIAEQAAARMTREYPNVREAGVLDGYQSVEKIVEAVRKSDANVVLVGMGMPKQEQVLFALRNSGFAGIALTCGGFLDQFVSGERYYPDWVNRYNLRSPYRLVKEPRRLWRRYLVEYLPFLSYVGAGVVLERTKLRPGWVPAKLRQLHAEATQALSAQDYVASRDRSQTLSF